MVVSGSARLKLEDEVLELGAVGRRADPGPRCAASRAGRTARRCSRSARPNTDNKDAEMVPGWWAD